MRKIPHEKLACSSCGSKKVELRDVAPRESLRGMLKSLLSPASGPGGRKYVVCKDCGHVSVIQVL